MVISVATATYYHLPFEQALEIIARAGFEFIELDLFWERKELAMAQHLRGCAPRDAARLIAQAGLKVASIHDGGGVLDGPDSICGFINPALAETLDALGYAPDCLVFHTPHVEGSQGGTWWQMLAGQAAAALEPYRRSCGAITIENMPLFDGYNVSMVIPEALMAFVQEAGLGVTLDTTHAAWMGMDITRAAEIFRGRVYTVHLSDFVEGKPHVFIGDGELDFPKFLRALDFSALRSITLECAPVFLGEDSAQMNVNGLAGRLATARMRLEGWLADL
jgi:sugar phosphate isomerase/epimerase